MKKNIEILVASISLVMLVLCACTTAPGEQAREAALTVTVLSTGRQCQPAPDGWTATWISSAEGLREMVSACSSHRIGAPSSTAPDVDFSRFGVLAVQMGQRPTAGYGFDVDGIRARASGRKATVELAHHGPAEGRMTAQVLTSPWILIQMPLGGYATIRVVDPEGRLLCDVRL